MTAPQEEPVPVGQAPTPEDHFYFEWGQETIKQNIPFANDVLRQLMTLSSALLGGSILVLKNSLLENWHSGSMCILFFFALITSFLGTLPFESKVDTRRPDRIKLHKEKALKAKRFFLWLSAAFLGAAFFVALIGLF